MPRYTNNELEFLQRAARELFNDHSLHVSQYGPWAGVIVKKRLVVHDPATNSWYVAHAPSDQPHRLSYYGAPVKSPEDVAERR